ncbi:asparaginase [Bernardetia sp.]|uniref:asparaginase n=1 Tax=Bernardetia sp. TaxID=1937974 RepID=UPI0025C453F9|nr:asparaginase [Bernardetia sp.]
MILDQYNIINLRTAADEDCNTSILVIYTGGTIGMDYDEKGSLVPFDFEVLLEKVPELTRFKFRLTMLVPFEPIDSSNMGTEHWLSMSWLIEELYDEFDGFVILHGTDTMAYSASALSFLLQNLAKPVILTGAQIPISAHRTDARENLIGALEIASMQDKKQQVIKTEEGKETIIEQNIALVPEVCVYFDNLLLRGNRSKKVQSLNFTAFESQNYPHLAEAGIFINYAKSYILPVPTKRLSFKSAMDDNVILWKIHPSMNPKYYLPMLESENLKGVVLESFGSGNIPTEKWVIDILEKIIKRGVVVVNVSQCAGGYVLQGHYETSHALTQIGVVSGNDLTSEAALTKLMFLFGSYDNEREREKIIELLQTPLCGEMTLF